MRHYFYCLILLFTSVFPVYADEPQTLAAPIGYWKTIDDVTGRPQSVIQIWENSNHNLMGKVVKIFPKPGDDPHKLCTACEGKNHNQPILGMVILTGLTLDNTQWDNGKILDPVNGKTYKCILKPYVNGKKLLVRGYIGFPLLGRTQTWEHLDHLVK